MNNNIVKSNKKHYIKLFVSLFLCILVVSASFSMFSACGTNNDNSNNTNNTKIETKSSERLEAEKLLSDDVIHRNLILEQLDSKYITITDIKIYLFYQSEWDRYDKLEGKETNDKYTSQITKDASVKFGMNEKDVEFRLFVMQSLFAGLCPKEPIILDDNNTVVSILFSKISLSNDNELLIDLINNTQVSFALPSLNMSFTLYKNGKDVGHQTVFAENCTKGTHSYRSFAIESDFDSVSCVVYANIDQMKTFKLKSQVQWSNDKGETVIPVYILEMYTLSL